MKEIKLIGAPTDIGASMTGMNLGPDALRSSGLIKRLNSMGYKVSDYGNIHGKLNPFGSSELGYKNLEAVINWNTKIQHQTSKALANGFMPILLGGDHVLSIGSVHAVANYCKTNNKQLLVLWLDAHADFNTSLTSPTGNMHGMPVSCLLGYGPKDLIGDTQCPSINKDKIRHIGIRSIDPGEQEFANILGLELYRMDRIRVDGIRTVMNEVLRNVESNTHIHVSFDVDFLDPTFAPGTGCRVIDGISMHKAKMCMELINETGKVGSVDIMELNPLRDTENKTCFATLNLIEDLLRNHAQIA